MLRAGRSAGAACSENESRALTVLGRYDEAWRRQLAALDHGELVREILAFVEKERIATDDGYMSLLLLPLGAYDLLPSMFMLWGEDNRRYRQSPQFKRFIRESGVYDYWRKAGFPEQCQPVGSDDFRCD